MQRIKMLVRYDGSRYLGWQRQPNTELTIQSQMELALSKLTQSQIKVQSSGRTDRGCHALGQVVHFDFSGSLENYQWPYSVNGILPRDIRVLAAWRVPDEFHALHSAEAKTYKYVVSFARPDPFTFPFRWVLRKKVDIGPLNSYCHQLIGELDFKSFQSAGTDLKTTVRTIHHAGWKLGKSNTLVFTVTGTGFLKQMVRNIVGTQIDLALGGKPPETFGDILAAADRRKALSTAPAKGLFLFKVKYPSELILARQRLLS